MEYIIGILILASFFGLAVYAARGGNLMMGMLIMAILWTILPMTGNLLASNPEFIAANGDSIRITWIQAFSKVFQSGPEGWGSVLVNVVFGAWFGRVLLETGIAATLIRKTTELGGDKPAVTCILLCIVTAAIFSSLFGAGAVVAIGVIILPIFMSLGIPKVLSVVSFMLSIQKAGTPETGFCSHTVPADALYPCIPFNCVQGAHYHGLSDRRLLCAVCMRKAEKLPRCLQNL